MDRASVVLIGRFNPAIFQPAWLASHGLIRSEEAEHAKGLVFSPEVASFTAEWLVMQVTSERFEAHTDDPAHAQPLRDLVLSIFGLLEHTPVEKMGINRHLHYQLESEERWHRLGHLLAPKDIWNNVLSDPGLRSLTVSGHGADAPGARVQVVVEPSAKFHPGVYISVNEHMTSQLQIQRQRSWRRWHDSGREFTCTLKEWQGSFSGRS